MPPIPNTPAFWMFTGLLAATGLMRLGEVVVSARRAQAREGKVVAEPWLFPLMATLHTGLVFAPLAEVLWLERAFSPVIGGAAVLLLVLATALRVWTLSTIGIAWNVRVVKPEEATVVTTGPYAWIRHPNYLMVILEIAALPLVHSAWIAAIALTALNAFVLWHRIQTEEAMLETLPAWRDAFSNKARFFPGLL